jgi:hypothetical protein
LTPEIVKSAGYHKGSYYTENADFSSAVPANIQYPKELTNNGVNFTGSGFDYCRGLGIGSRKLANGN